MDTSSSLIQAIGPMPGERSLRTRETVGTDPSLRQREPTSTGRSRATAGRGRPGSDVDAFTRGHGVVGKFGAVVSVVGIGSKVCVMRSWMKVDGVADPMGHCRRDHGGAEKVIEVVAWMEEGGGDHEP